MRNRNKVSKSFRLPVTLLEQLDDRAETEGLSLNQMVEHTVAKYINFYQYVDLNDAIILSRKNVDILTDSISDDMLESLAQETAGFVKTLLFSKYGNITIDTMIKGLQENAHLLGLGACIASVQQGRKVLAIQHNINRKWGLYLSKVINEVNGGFDLMLTENSITLIERSLES